MEPYVGILTIGIHEQDYSKFMYHPDKEIINSFSDTEFAAFLGTIKTVTKRLKDERKKLRTMQRKNKSNN